jgi:hypothetical protein
MKAIFLGGSLNGKVHDVPDTLPEYWRILAITTDASVGGEENYRRCTLQFGPLEIPIYSFGLRRIEIHEALRKFKLELKGA